MITNFSTSQNFAQIDSVCLPTSLQSGAVRFSVDSSTGEITEVTASALDEGARARFSGSLVLNAGIVSGDAKTAEKSVFERVSRRFRLQDQARILLPAERVSHCLRWRFSVENGIGIQFVEKVKRAHYSNLQTCGLPWVCPVCAAKISERRRVELSQAVDQWRAAKNSVFLVTLTMRHSAGDALSSLISDLNGAYRKVRGGRVWERFEKKFRIVGSVTAHEITYGQGSGFHPHKHILFFSQGELTHLEEFEIWFILTHRWQTKLSDFGRDASDLVGVDVQVADCAVSDYVTKWGLVEEITKAPSKQGKVTGQHYSPFQLLDLVESGSVWARDAFLEYAKATKGKNQLTWSSGLRDLFELGEDLTDLEIAEKQEEKAILLLTLCWPEWRAVLRARARAVLLEIASTGRAELVQAYILGLGVKNG